MRRCWILGLVVVTVGCHPQPSVAYKHLYQACEARNLKEIQAALAEGADINAPNPDPQIGLLPLEVVVDSPELVQALLKAGAAPKKPDTRGYLPLGMAAASGKPQSMEYLLKAGALLEGKDADGRTAMAYAAASGKMENAKFLVNCGANLNQKDRLGYTPLFQLVTASTVSSIDRTEMARYLIEHGADITTRDAKGRTVAYYADTREARETGSGQELIEMLNKPSTPPAK